MERIDEDSRGSAELPAAQLARFFEASVEAFVVAGFDGRFHAVNPAFERVFGFRHEDIAGTPYVELVHPDDREQAMDQVERVTSHGETLRFQCRFADARGSFRHVEWAAAPDGETEVFYAIGRDVTEETLSQIEMRNINAQREVARREAQEIADRYYDLLNNSSDMIYTVTLDGVYLEANRATARSYGLEPEDVIGRPVSDLLEVDYDSPAIRAFHERLQERGRLNAQPMRIKTAQGETAYLEASHRMLYDDEGQPYAVQSIARNVTERRRAEMRLEAMNEQLQAKTDEALTLASQAEASARAKAEFLANMSHEIRTPMNGVVGMTDLLRHTNLDAEQRDFVETIRSSADSLLTVIGDVLDFSKLESGKLTFQDADFDLREAMENVAGLLAPEAHRKGVEFVLDVVPPEFRSVLRGDAGRLRQVLVNLVGNAIKFTDSGEVGLHARVLEESEENATIQIDVTDTGIGIPEHLQAEVFESFTQVEASASRRFGGTGLGLAITRQIVELMGGTVSVQSAPEQGSTFTVTLNYPRRAAVDSDHPAESIEGRRVLIVDDNETNRRVLVQQLESWGILSVAVRSGREALAMLRVIPEFDLVLMDMQMPEMDGEETTDRIRSELKLGHIPVVLLSSGISLTAEESRARGFSAALLKPVRMSTLLDGIATVLHPEGSGAVTPAEPLTESTTLDLRVLLAEDNPINQKVAVAMLKRWNCETTVVPDGQEALDAVRASRFDVVLMDCHMPVMDGYQATAAIRAYESHEGRHTPIIAMTANALQGDRERCITAGMDDYVPKPVKPEALFEAMAKWTGGEAQTEPEPLPAPFVVFDNAQFMESCGGDVALAEELASDFMEQCSNGLAQLGSLIINRDGPGLKQEAHRLKGSCYAVGAFLLARRMADLEAAAATDAFGQANDLLSKANGDFIATGEAMSTDAMRDAA